MAAVFLEPSGPGHMPEAVRSVDSRYNPQLLDFSAANQEERSFPPTRAASVSCRDCVRQVLFRLRFPAFWTPWRTSHTGDSHQKSRPRRGPSRDPECSSQALPPKQLPASASPAPASAEPSPPRRSAATKFEFESSGKLPVEPSAARVDLVSCSG